MKKRFLSVIVLSAALLSVQAQEGKGGISPKCLDKSSKVIKARLPTRRSAMP